MEQAKKQRRFVTLPMDDDEFDALQLLVVEVVKSKNTPTSRADIMREALNMKAKQVTGKAIFNEQ